MRVTVISPVCTLGAVGAVVDVDEGVYNVRALIRSRLVEVAPEPVKKRKTRKESSEGADD